MRLSLYYSLVIIAQTESKSEIMISELSIHVNVTWLSHALLILFDTLVKI